MPEIVGWDYVGEDDEVGADDEIVGATARKPVRRAAPQGGGQGLRAENLPQSIVGIPPTNIPAGSPGVLIQIPVQRNIRPDRLVLDRVQAASVLVYQLSIGTTNLFASGNPVPGDMFAPDAIGTTIRAVETATPSVGLSLTVGNRGTTPIDKFVAAIIGPSTKA